MDESELPEDQNVELKPKIVVTNGEKVEEDVTETDDTKMKVKDDKTDPVLTETTKNEPNNDAYQSELKIIVKSPSASSIDASMLYNEPLFAEICSFFNYFACYLSMKPLSIVQLEKMFLNTEAKEEIDRELLELHLTLMRKIGYKSARQDRWEGFLQKFLTFINADEESLQLERCGYPYLSFQTKLQILFQLCVRQFDHNLKFKEAIFNTLSYNELRLAPVGRDKHGLNYFYQQDNELNIRVYTQEPEDESGGTWSLVVRSHTDLINLIESLKKPSFGLIKEDHDEDLDETALLEVDTTKSPVKANGIHKEPSEEEDPDFWKLLKPEVAEKYYNYLAKRNTFKDVFRDGIDINKKKNEKLAKKEAKAAAAATASAVPHATPKQEKAKSEEKEEESQEASATQEEPEIPPELLEEEEGRRILPKRNARNAAMNNLKSFTHTPTKKKVEEKKKEETEEESDDEEDEDSDLEDGSDPSLGSSDEEFNIGNGKKKSSPRKPRKPKNEDDDGEPKKKKKKKKVIISFEDTSEEEMEEEQVKERKKATIHSLCMKCNKATHPEVLLLCDMCDDPWHTFCLKPTLWYVPDDDWFCPKCHHAMLVNRLEKIEIELCESLKVKKAEETKKKAAAERLQREMEYIGVSLNNVIHSSNTRYGGYDDDEISESESNDDGQRKSKKRALKKVMGSIRRRERFMGPIVTIAEGRSRRQTKKVDYNFSAYDEQLQEAMDVIDEPTIKTKYENDHRPSGGIGQKDMSNILNANRRIHDDEYEDENDEPVPKKRKTKSKRLTDLDVDATDSDTDEYKASEQSEDEAEPSEEEYIPSDVERGRRRSGRRAGRRISDEEFIDDGGSDSDYRPSKKKRKGAGTSTRRSGGRKKWGRVGSDEDSENEEYFDDESSDDGYRKKRKPKSTPTPKRKNKVESEEDEDEEAYSEDDDRPKKMTAYGRPMRKAAAKAVLKESDDEEEEVEPVPEEKEKRPVGALTRKIEKEEEFEPDEEEEEEADEEEVEAEEELEKEAVDENEEEEPEESSSLEDDEEEEEEVPTMVKKGSTPKKTPPKPKERRAPPAPTKDQHEPIERRVQPARSPAKKQVSVEKKQEQSPAPPQSQPMTASVPPVASATPPMVKPIPITVCQPSSSMSYQQFAPPPVSSIYSPYTTAASLPRFAPPPSSYGPPLGGYYPAPTYGHPLGHPPMMPTYVMQPPVGPYGGHPGFPQNTMTMLDPMNPHGHGHIPPSPYGLQPIQLSQPSDSDGLAQAIAGAMNSDL